MRYQTEEVEVIGVGLWNEEDPNYGEFVRVKADGEETDRRYTLAKELTNGSRPEVGSRVVLSLISRMHAQAYIAGNGEARNRWREKFKAVGCEVKKPAKLSAAA